MLTLLKDWKGSIDIDDKHYDTVQDAVDAFKSVSDTVSIKLYSANKNASQCIVDALESELKEYKITVKKYMTEKASPSFDFMAKWNNDNPMPLRTMIGIAEKETKGMVYMKLHGFGEPEVRCMRCGRLLTNPVSKLYGIGPECMSKLGFVCDIEDVDSIKSNLQEIKWEGWIIKSAITEKEEV